ncbi:hypothetical protein M409DRAFT_71432 [Zasmidium cellare ATCC 36951]|uniref:RING-type domain-containing protein n=1 Tax=Zasmidium cellare ATCC 36951 TaxID=1080233 RepID=A0A6A6BXU9_ZASCE|nr:uncharacterized protein M409DRAFT_71432 [Zasmidium cellare ATCC 36951]KAF2158888.1 hypothetical protein M409DRAFT_71432 [Zasmidium cellare ATCC 36951]
MAPRKEHAFATVLSAQVRSSDEQSILVEAGGVTPMRWFLEHGQPDTEGPPKKRRRLQDNKREAQTQDDHPKNEEIPLFEASIDFHFPETLKAKSPSKRALEDDISFEETAALPVVVYGVESDVTATKLRLALHKVNGPVLVLESQEVSDEVLGLLRTIALPGQLKAAISNKRVKESPASLISCTLTRSVGDLYTVFRLQASLRWRSGSSAFVAGAPVGAAKIYPDYDLLLQAFPDHVRDAVNHSQPWTPQDFYESVHAPSRDVDVEGKYDNVLESELYPFQKRAISWMLGREGAEPWIQESPRFYKKVNDADGRECFVNHLQGIVTREPPDDEAKVSGGLLAEEMGLGKTVEILALLSLHRRTHTSSDEVFDGDSETMVKPSRATLIITPPSILQQWKSELNRHAPNLKVHHYQGIPKAYRKGYSEADLIQDLATKYDVVLTTYGVLGAEIHFAEDPPDRNMRHAPKFERKKSPLIQLQWWRICLDEAQMVDTGVTAAARVACRLPRVHSWAVSGTPLRKNVEDLHGLLIFLRFKPLSLSSKLWGHLVTNHKHLFKGIFGNIALRHTKALIRDELRLPPQKRVVISCPFSVVEQQNYATLFDQMCEEVGLNADGSPRHDDWEPSQQTERMRRWLSRLRQTCLHPQVGAKNRKAPGGRAGPLRTVAEVLAQMIEQNETDLRTREREALSASLKRAHIIGNNGEDQHRSEKALKLYEEAMISSEHMVKEAREHLAAAKTVATEKGEATVDTDDEDSSSESTPVLGRLRNALRVALNLHHVSLFFTATAYHQIKSNEALTEEGSDAFKKLEANETDLYERAKILRKEIMSATARKAEGLMRQVKDVGDNKTATKIPKIKDLQSFGGIESRKIVEKADELFDEIRTQVSTIKQWRADMVKYLVKPLVDEEGDGIETTGDEYEDSTKQQDELYVYFDAMKSVYADLNTYITGESAPLVDHEVKMLVKGAKMFLDPDVAEEHKPQGVHAPELLLKLISSRVQDSYRKRRTQLGSVRSLIQEARTLESAMEWSGSGSRAAAEHALVKQHLDALNGVFSSYTKALNGLEKEIDLFRVTQNQRVEFYRQLQELSDDVAPYKEEHDPQLDHLALGLVVNDEDHANNHLAQLRTKHRFLLHLRDENGAETESKICVICRDNFEHGVLTVCGHQFCKDCITHWFAQSKLCPMCKRQLTKNDVHDIAFKPQELRAQEEAQSSDSSSSRNPTSPDHPIQTSIYSDVDPKLMDEIKSIDLPKSYGSKIDTLGRHLHWIREHDPGAKSIVFSQYREFLDVLGSALREFKIGYARLGRAGSVEKFRNDPSIDCLLLDAKTDSSGLTLVNATHVFICEPLIQTAVELQAIARVHRIGQTRPTTVWMYLINETVEESIYEISVARRLSHMQSRQQQGESKQKSRASTPAPLENALDAANSEELQSAPLTKLLVTGKAEGELVGNDDLWQCLFGKAQTATANPAVAREVGRHLRAEAAEQRRGGESSMA